MLARYYTSQAGRFLSVDPVIGKGALQTPTLWNRYAYVMDSPLRYVDPDGQLLQFSACVANVSSEACAAQYNLYLSTFGKQSKEAAKYLELGKDGTVRFKNTTGQEFAKTFGMIGRASNYLISNRAAVFTIAFGSVSEGAKFDDTKGGGGTITLDLSQFPRTLVGVSVSSTEALVHEMGHAISTLIPGYAERLNLRAGTSFITKMTPRNEAYATVFENAWRRLVAGETTIRSGYVVAGDVRDLGDVSLFP